MLTIHMHLAQVLSINTDFDGCMKLIKQVHVHPLWPAGNPIVNQLDCSSCSCLHSQCAHGHLNHAFSKHYKCCI